MSCHSAAALRASSNWSRRSRVCRSPRGAAGGGHQPGRMLRDEFLVDPGPLDQPALGVGPGGEPEQVVHARVVLGPDGLVQVGPARGDVILLLVRLAPQDAIRVGSRLGRDVRLDPDHRGDARVLGLPVELGGPEHVAVVGHRHVRHALVLDLRHQVFQPGGTVQHGVLGVHVQVGERLTRSRHDEPPPQGTLRSTHSPAEASLGAACVVINPVLTSLVEGSRCRRVAAPARSGWCRMSISGSCGLSVRRRWAG